MKAIKLMILLFFGTGSLFAQDVLESRVPSIIVNSFKKEFPKASDVEWERQGDGYNVDFEIGLFRDFEAWFSASGKLIRYSEEISNRNLPKAVKDSIRNKLKGYQIDDAKKFTDDGVITYSVEIEKGNDKRKLHFSEGGNEVQLNQ